MKKIIILIGIITLGINAFGEITNLAISTYLNNSFYYFNNGDLRELDNSSIDTVENTDDAVGILYSKVGFKMSLTAFNSINLYIDAYKPFFWGNDSAEYNSRGNSIFLREIFSKIEIIKENNINLFTKIGRQEFSLSRNEFKNFVFRDIVDAILICFNYDIIGFDLGIDFFSMNTPTENIYAIKGDRHPYTVKYFDGDVNIYKTFTSLSLTFSNNIIKENKTKIYTIFSRIGAVGENVNQGGWELSKGGTEGNFADNDFVLIGGLNSYINLQLLSIYFDGAISYGIDRKHREFPKVNILGFLTHLGLGLYYEIFEIKLEGAYVSGAEANTNGDYINYGFVSAKGDRVGGLLFSSYYGNYPSSIINYSGITFKPFDTQRYSPTAFLSIKLGIIDLDLNKLSKEPNNGISIIGEFHTYLDTSTTLANLNSTDLRPEVYNQKRFGELLGIETDLTLKYKFFNETVEMGGTIGIFIPFDFFLIPVSIPKAPYGISNFVGTQIFFNIKI